jgi:ATP-dependent Clp protease ATP-binding subunit ClpB
MIDELRQSLTSLLRKTIRPEFLNRIDEVVLFKPLRKSELRQIVELQINILRKMLSDKNITLNIDDEAMNWLSEIGYDVTFGARPLKRTIQRYLVNPLSTEILMGSFSDGDVVNVTLGEKGHLEFLKKE